MLDNRLRGEIRYNPKDDNYMVYVVEGPYCYLRKESIALDEAIVYCKLNGIVLPEEMKDG